MVVAGGAAACGRAVHVVFVVAAGVAVVGVAVAVVGGVVVGAAEKVVLSGVGSGMRGVGERGGEHRGRGLQQVEDLGEG